MPLLEVWETGLIELAGTEEDVLDRVKAAIARADQAAWTSGTLRDWTWENHLTARDQIYPLLEGREELVLSAAQVEAATNVVVERLAKSAVRLASILDDVWPR